MSDLVKRLRSRGGASGGIFAESADRIEQIERAHARSQGAEADLAAMLIRAERAEAELVALRAATAPVAYIWHSHIGLGAKSLRWSRPNQGEVAGEVTPLYFAAAAPAAPTNAAPRESPIPQGQLPDQNLERTKAAAPEQPSERERVKDERIKKLERDLSKQRGIANHESHMVGVYKSEAELAALRAALEACVTHPEAACYSQSVYYAHRRIAAITRVALAALRAPAAPQPHYDATCPCGKYVFGIPSAVAAPTDTRLTREHCEREIERLKAELAALRHERDDPIAAAMGRAAPAAPGRNKPIADLMREYENDGNDFSDVEWLRSASIRYVRTMEDSQIRCLLHAWAVRAAPAAPEEDK